MHSSIDLPFNLDKYKLRLNLQEVLTFQDWHKAVYSEGGEEAEAKELLP